MCSTAARLWRDLASLLVPRLTQMLFPDRVTDHLVLVARDIRNGAVLYQIENDGDIWPGLWLPQILGHQLAHILGKGDTPFGGLGVGAPPHPGIHRYLCACIHDGAIMPSPIALRQSKSPVMPSVRRASSSFGRSSPQLLVPQRAPRIVEAGLPMLLPPSPPAKTRSRWPGSRSTSRGKSGANRHRPRA